MSKANGKWLGICVILSFLSYGIGMSLMEVINTPEWQYAPVLEQKNRIITGGILVTVFHSVSNIAWLVMMYGRLAIFHSMLSIFYLGSGLMATVILAMGGIFMLLPVFVNDSGKNDQLLFSAIVAGVSAINFYAYQTGMFIWAVGGLTFCYLLNRFRLVPLIFPVWGSVGYLIFIAGIMLELFGISTNIVLSIPGGLFEVVLGIWLMKYGHIKEY